MSTTTVDYKPIIKNVLVGVLLLVATLLVAYIFYTGCSCSSLGGGTPAPIRFYEDVKDGDYQYGTMTGNVKSYVKGNVVQDTYTRKTL